MKIRAPRKLLLVEDDRVLLDRLATSLRRRGHEVATASDMAETARILETFSPDHALVDLRLGRESGLDAVRFLKRRVPSVRVLVISGYGSIPAAVDAMRLGAVDFLSKPADTDQIEAALFGDGASDHEREDPAIVPSLDRVEWEYIQRVLHDCSGNISEAARRLGIERRTLQRKLQKYPPNY